MSREESVAPNVDLAAFREIQRRKIREDDLPITVRRSHVLEDSFRQLRNLPPSEFLRRIRITYEQEMSCDGGGALLRDWLQCLATEIFRQDRGFFTRPSDGYTYSVNPRSCRQDDYVEMFRFAGRIVARTVIEAFKLPISLCRSLLTHLLGLPVSLRDVDDYDNRVYQTFVTLLQREEDPGAIGLYFEVFSQASDPPELVLLKPGGDEIEVTRENLEEYIQLFLDYKLGGEYSVQLNAFLEGFHDLIPKEEITLFRPEELGVLISGVPEIDPDEFANHVVYSGGYSRDHPVIKLFFEVFREFTHEERGMILGFVTGSCRIPVEGFGYYAKTGHPFTISLHGTPDHLPQAHCDPRILGLPPYESKTAMREKLLSAINCHDCGFALE
jgi:E3 ubiquitin-protein ligase HUWE1